MVANFCDPSCWGGRVRGTGDRSQPQLHSEFEASLGYIRPWHKKEKFHFCTIIKFKDIIKSHLAKSRTTFTLLASTSTSCLGPVAFFPFGESLHFKAKVSICRLQKQRAPTLSTLEGEDPSVGREGLEEVWESRFRSYQCLRPCLGSQDRIPSLRTVDKGSVPLPFGALSSQIWISSSEI